MSAINFTAPPTVAAFMKSEAFFRLCAGPVGSGKTTGCIFELLRRAIEQPPGEDGLRHTRFAIVRQTLRQLKDTVLKDIMQWLGEVANYRVSENTIHIRFGDVISEWLLIPLDDPEDQKRLLSMQLTGAWLSEAIEMSVDIVQPVLGRCGRYPSGKLGKALWYGAIADTNMPTDGDPWHRLMAEDTPPDWHVFIQPGGLDPDAENLENLPDGRGYYERLADGKKNSPHWVERYVHARYGPDPSGSAVFKDTFKRGFHTVKLSDEQREEGIEYALMPDFSSPLIVLQDFGRAPCSLIAQVDHKGRGLILEEVVANDTGLELHIQQSLRPALMQARFMGRSVYVIGDPSGRSKNTHYEETSFDLLKKMGLKCYPAPTNDISKRLQAVDTMLLQQRDGGAALLIDEDKCPILVRGMEGKYRYAKRRSGQLSPLPEKLHPWSDLADDLQYFCLVIQGGMHGYIAERLPGGARSRTVMAVEGATGPRQRFSSRAWT